MSDDDFDRRGIFFDRFAPFENEQLGCVHDFLIDQVSPPFKDVAAHDIAWGESQIHYIDDYDAPENACKESLISKCLTAVYQLKCAKTYDERYKRLDAADVPPFDQENLFNDLQCVDDPSLPQLSALSADAARELSVPPVSIETDEGPFDAWRWAYSEHSPNVYFKIENWFFRTRAYVMWDKKRLDEWELLSSPRGELPEEIDNAVYADESEVRKQHGSWEARCEIWRKGGRGWWSFDDVTQMEWPANVKMQALSAR